MCISVKNDTWERTVSVRTSKKRKDCARVGSRTRLTHVGSYGAALGNHNGQIEEGSSEEKASSTHERISTWRFLPQALADYSTHPYTQHSRHTRDDAKIQTRKNSGRVLEWTDTVPQDRGDIMSVHVLFFFFPGTQKPKKKKKKSFHQCETVTMTTAKAMCQCTWCWKWGHSASLTLNIWNIWVLYDLIRHNFCQRYDYVWGMNMCDSVYVCVCNLSEVSQGSWMHGSFSPVKTAALKRKAGAQRASDPVTKATAVKPNVDRTKLLLQKDRKRDGAKVKKTYTYIYIYRDQGVAQKVSYNALATPEKTLAGCGHLEAHVCKRQSIALFSECIASPHDATWAAVQKDVEFSFTCPRRKMCLFFPDQLLKSMWSRELASRWKWSNWGERCVVSKY